MRYKNFMRFFAFELKMKDMSISGVKEHVTEIIKEYVVYKKIEYTFNRHKMWEKSYYSLVMENNKEKW